jgi:hypothetical protein
LTAILGFAFACSSNSATSKHGNDAGNGNNYGSDAGQGLSFVPSNVPAVEPNATLAAATITGDCTINTTAGTIGCLDEADYTAETLIQNDVDGTSAMVFTMSSLTLTNAAIVTVAGNRPLIIVANGAINVAGTLTATPGTFSSSKSQGGGFSSPTGGEGKGGGLGAGSAPSAATHTGAGGGAFCGKGGNANGGVPYGNPEISPLLGGSSGGSGLVQGGGGGGAIQLISGENIVVATTGVIHVGGGGAFFGGNGGGSGGAILLEAPTVTVRGTLAANGGAGSANSGGGEDSSNASPDAVAAPGGTTTSTSSTGVLKNPGGSGSAGAIIDGSAGLYVENPSSGFSDYGGGGGGGAGRICINTASGQAAITGTLSPAVGTSCVSQHKVKSR